MPEIQTQTIPQSFSSALGSKAITWIHTHSFGQFCLFLASVAVFGYGCFAMLNPARAGALALSAASYEAYLIPRLILVAVFIFRFRWFLSAAIWAAKKIARSYRKHHLPAVGRMVGGVPAEEIINFLFEFQSFPALLSQKRFGINTHAYQKIIAELSRSKLIVRGASNAWIRNPEISRSAAAAFLHTSNPPLRIVDNGTVTYRSSADEAVLSREILESIALPENA